MQILTFRLLFFCLLRNSHDGNRLQYAVLGFDLRLLLHQAFVNIGVVVSLLPVMGVPMPFVSAGGSSLIMCLGAAGVAISLMKEQPQVKAENRIL